MTYRADIEKFKESNIWKSNNSIENNTGYSVGLFPFRTGSNQVYDMENAIKGFLTEVDQKELKLLNPEQLIHQIEQEPDLVSGIEKEETRKLFEQIIKVMFYQGDELRVKNLRTMMSNAKSSKDDKKVSRFLRDVLGDQKILKAAMDQKLEEDESSANTFEKLVFKKMDLEDLTSDEKKSGFIQVLNWLAPSFEKDFKFIVSDTGRTKDYLVQMVEFYCFTYMSYLILTLNDFLHGSREQSRQLFYALEWEKTTQSRDCYHLGWKQIDNYLDTLFPHAIVFELLNFRDGEEENVDYIKLFDILQAHEDEDEQIAQSIRAITDLYGKGMIGTSRDLQEDVASLKDNQEYKYKTEREVHYLFDLVSLQFKYGNKKSASDRYKGVYESFAQKFLKNRKRNGSMLNLTEGLLIMLTILAIGEQSQIKLNDLFTAFEDRGVFLDSASRKQVTQFYEKLNLIEKKSDSGDSMYVKRIL